MIQNFCLIQSALQKRKCNLHNFNISQVKEAELGLAADVGALQQLPKVIGSASLARELCLSARKFHSDEAKECGFVNRVFEDKDE